MKTPIVLLASVLLFGGLVAGVWRWNAEPTGPPAFTGTTDSKLAKKTSPPVLAAAPATAPITTPANSATASSDSLESRIAALEAAVTALHKAVETRGVDAGRVAALEKSVKTLQSAMNGVSIEKASADRQALFAGEEGYVKANEYFEAGKYAIAAEGYLTFIEAHPDHPDTREVMKKARDAFLRAGFKDKAFWVHDEMMRGFPEHAAADIEELAVIEKNAGMYDRAVEHMAQAAEMAANPEARLWKRLYWAWYVQMRDGNAAGIAALQQVQQEIATSGVKNPRLGENAAKRLAEWQKQMAQQKR